MDILEIANLVIQKIQKQGLQGDVIVSDCEIISVSQRLLKMEETSQSKNLQIGIRIILNNKSACISSSNLQDLDSLLKRVTEMAKSSPEDKYISLVALEECNHHTKSDDLEILDNRSFTINEMKDFINIAEESALSFPDITNSEGSVFTYKILHSALATSNGFANTYSKSIFSSHVSVVAGSSEKMETDYDYTIACKFENLKNPSELGKEAARRALLKLNPQKIKTCRLPVIIENRAASKLLSTFASAINGENIVNGSSFLINRHNGTIFKNDINIIDDALIKSGVSTRPFDGEGIQSRANLIVENGVLKNWILDTYSANRLNLKTTANAIRGGNASIKPGISNLYIKNGSVSLNYLMKDIKEGLYIIDLFGFGVNLTTGDYSQGAFGFWIKDGKLAYPVHEITVADNLVNMFYGMEIADDLSFVGAINSPTIKIQEMTIAGSLL